MTEEEIAKRTLKHGAKYPYDAPDEWWERSGEIPPEPTDWAHSAARGVLADLNDRRGIKQGFSDLDEDVRVEIVTALSNIIRASRPAPSEESTDSADAIQEIIDLYAIAGANLLNWLSEDDLAEMPRSHRGGLWPFRQRPSEHEWERWASDVACRAAFEALREAKEKVSALTPAPQADALREAEDD